MAVDAEKFSESLSSGKSLRQSMMDAGYSARTANNGMARVSKRVMKALTRDARKMLLIADEFTIQELGKLAVARLALNCMSGKDGGVMSAKTLGSHKDLALWQPDSQVGVVVLNAPNQLMQKKAELVEAEEVKE